MHIEFSTADFTRTDAVALLALIHAEFPDLKPAERKPALTATKEDIARALRGQADVDLLITDPVPQDAGGGELLTADKAFAEPPALDPAAAFGALPLADASQDGEAAPAGAPSAAPVGAPLATQVDSQGLPWDERIHASTKRLNADGTWTGKKRLPAGVKETVTAELRRLYPQRPTATASAPVAAPAPASSVSATDASAASPAPSVSSPPPPAPPLDAGAPPPPPPPLAPEAIAAAQADALADPTFGDGGQSPAAAFAGAMKIATDAQARGKLDAKDISNILADLHLTQMRELIANPDKIAPFIDQVNAYVASAA